VSKIEDYDDYVEIRLQTLRSLLRSGDKVDVNVFKDIIVDPFLAGSYLEGIVMRNRNRAEPVLRKIFESEPDCLPAVYLLVKVLSADCRYDEIELLLTNCIDSCSSNLTKAYLLYLIGSAYINVNNDKAFSYLKAASETGGTDPDILMDCAKAMVRGGWLDEAKKLLKKAYRGLEPATNVKRMVKQILKTGDVELLKEIELTAGMIMRSLLSVTEEEFDSFFKKFKYVAKKYKPIFSEVVRETIGDIPKIDTSINSLLEKYRKTGYLTDDDANIWTAILNEERPGFEMYLAYRFFHGKCGSCCHPEGQKAEKGGPCPLDAEFLEYIYEVVEEIVKKLSRGEDLSMIPELDIPDWINRRMTKIKTLVKS